MADFKTVINGGFFDSIDNDRQYTANDMNRPYRRVITEGVFASPLGTPSTDIKVISSKNGMNITIKAGEGLLADKWFQNPADFQITVPNNATSVPRRDSVFVRIDNRQSAREPSIIYRTGVANSNPMPPNRDTTSGVVEKRVANIYVAAGASYIGDDAITDLRGSDELPWITSLIKQVDTSTLLTQFEAAYWGFYNSSRESWRVFMEEISEEFAPIVNTNIVTYQSTYVSLVNGETQIPINIPTYDKDKDVLLVMINHLSASKNIDYTISNDSSNIILTKSIQANQNVDFLVLQSVVVGDTATVLSQLGQITTILTALNSDTGWINLTLQNGAIEYSSGLIPAYRKTNKDIHIRGCIKGAPLYTIFATLPEGCRPAMTRYYTIATGNVTATIEIGTNGQMIIANVIGTLTTSTLIPIDTTFIVD